MIESGCVREGGRDREGGGDREGGRAIERGRDPSPLPLPFTLASDATSGKESFQSIAMVLTAYKDFLYRIRVEF